MAKLQDLSPWRIAPVECRPLLILSCSATKIDPGAPAQEAWQRFAHVYDGPLWRDVRSSGFPLGNVAALSAGHGFLQPGHPIRPYNIAMDDKRAQMFRRGGEHIHRLADLVKEFDFALVVGGQLYRSIAEAAAERYPEIRHRIDYATGSFLQQRKQLGAWLRRQTIPLFTDR